MKILEITPLFHIDDHVISFIIKIKSQLAF